MKKALWHHKDGYWGAGGGVWELRDVAILAETKECYKIGFLVWVFPVVKWIFKDSTSDKVELIKK